MRVAQIKNLKRKITKGEYPTKGFETIYSSTEKISSCPCNESQSINEEVNTFLISFSSTRVEQQLGKFERFRAVVIWHSNEYLRFNKVIGEFFFDNEGNIYDFRPSSINF